MRLRNKKTGVIGEVGYISTSTGDILVSNIHDQEEWYHYKSLAALNEEWEDYEEPKEPKEPKDTNYWCIDSLGKIEFHSTVLDEIDGTPNNSMTRKIIGNYFDTREEAEKAVEKLKAWKRLEDTGCEPITWNWKQGYPNDACYVEIILKCRFDAGVHDRELNLLFGGEE